jgi:hypothetical protein
VPALFSSAYFTQFLTFAQIVCPETSTLGDISSWGVLTGVREIKQGGVNKSLLLNIYLVCNT